MKGTCACWSRLVCLTLSICAATACATTVAVGQPADDSITPIGKVELVQDGFAFTEGPAWEPQSKRLFFTDIPNTAIHQLASDGTVTTFSADSKHNNGLVVTGDGKLLGCQMDGQVVQYDLETATATVLASQFEGKRFNAPNDLTVDSQGGIYFTDPLFRAPTPLPQSAQAVYYIAPGGDVSRVSTDLPAPNGIGLSPDGKRLYVCPSKQAEMLVYDVTAPGKLSPPRTFCTLQQPAGSSDTGADGIALDVHGNLYITTHIGVQIYSPQGKQRGVVSFPEQPANVCFGGDDWQTMYVTARTGLYRVKMPIPGLH
ncbi:SMP-30/gluconolactonase/LRE family protein [Stieleria sp. TO1_6]|uniref:SMP-30/gluconolactonase/LRE family protein n=1 Tax=Stieleria tagensis TaxID=2956795 RepID=UPI00209BB432|nr:SMP-30/gluconolactonase/LRE family protein [Stieleria tagensis]MCO8122793.1 SMP-30/gluconolactonase/LRE family protein [Stieleria tagensis]